MHFLYDTCRRDSVFQGPYNSMVQCSKHPSFLQKNKKRYMPAQRRCFTRSYFSAENLVPHEYTCTLVFEPCFNQRLCD